MGDYDYDEDDYENDYQYWSLLIRKVIWEQLPPQ